MNKIKKVGIVIKPHAPEISKIIQELTRWLKERKIECILEKPAAEKIGEKSFTSREEIAKKVDLIIVLGGIFLF